MRRTVLLTALLLLSAFPLSADESLYTITPASGPASGGTTVTIKGPLGSWPYSVVFDGGSATTTTRIDENTLEAVTPLHQPGFSRVRLFEYDIYIDTGLTFEFVGPVEREQFLLPVFIPPVQGAFGSEFRTELRGVNSSMEDPNDTIEVWGLETSCRPSPPICNWLMEPMVFLQPGRHGVDIFDYSPYQTGTPGRFIEVPREQVGKLSLNLRVYDTSRSAENFGTAIPIVPRSEFRHQPFALLGVPLDPRFRNTLRVYATGPTKVQVQIGDETQELTLRGGEHVFDPAFAQLTAGSFPTGSGTTNVIITPDDPTGPAVWAFISVTNNDTQHITTISPR
jgi:hypothetical protein